MKRARSTFKRVLAPIRHEGGFTLIEVLTVLVLVGITSVMFETVFGTVVNRSSQVQGQNILQTEVRASLNQLVSELRDATYGDATVPFAGMPTATSISFYSPDRLSSSSSHMRQITYRVSGNSLQRQVLLSTNTSGPPWTFPSSSSSPFSTLFSSIQNPSSVFKYCTQTPRDMAMDPVNNSTSAELITWTCSAPTVAANVKTVVVRTVVSTVGAGEKFNYGAVATLRWNAS
jgi:prepilin-type N-terminal cleavage/methylation domain-containing protein